MSQLAAIQPLGASAGPRIRARRGHHHDRVEHLMRIAPRSGADLGLTDWRQLLRSPVSPGPATWLDWVSLREINASRRRVRHLLRNLDARLAEGCPLRELRSPLEETLTLDPGFEPARLLLACLHLETDQPLSALVQLAPLRDRHPDHGEVVLLAAIAYAQLGRARECHRMLTILDGPASHPATPAIHRLRRRVCEALGLETECGPPSGGPLANSSR